jgi:hypothetical protein
MIKVLNLINGEEIIGDVNEDDVSEYSISYPFYMTIVDDTDQGTGVRMDYVLAFSKQTSVQIRKTDVLYSYIPSDRMEKYYHRLVEYSATRENDKVLQETLESMEEMDQRYKALISRKLVGNNSVN